ncbi:MAG: hypothetical protein KJ645_07285 [Planctomycetes bacterium]|nr:hypothetical protein [Planctomycetota bacterium]
MVGIYARSRKTLLMDGRSYEVYPLKTLDQESLSRTDLIYQAVSKDQVPPVLHQLNRFELAEKDLLIDTPVLCFKHFHHAPKLKQFRNTWVAEDCSALPFFDPIRLALKQNVLDGLEEIEFDRSAYKYHGLSSLKSLFGCNTILSARSRKSAGKQRVRTLRFSNGKIGRMIEPRDYALGSVHVRGPERKLTDRITGREGSLLLEPIRSGTSWDGFRIAELRVHLEPEEIDLIGSGKEEDSIFARMDGMKRVGLFRLFESIHKGEGAYPLVEAMDDMVIDYYLDKVGFYRANPFMSIKSSLGFSLLRILTRMAGR